MRRATILFAFFILAIASSLSAADAYKVISWNDLGMHCTDGVDYSVFGVLPPYNTVNSQVIDPTGHLIRNAFGLTVGYQAVADPSGSINRSSIGKTNFWIYVEPLFGVALAPDSGLAGSKMPGASNVTQSTTFDTTRLWFGATGIPITPFDDSGKKNYYPMMRFTARDATGTALASTGVVLPVSDEMDCRACHASGGSPAAQPAIGWAWDPDPARDVKLNVLAIHDQHQIGNAAYASALAAQGYDATGLRATSLGGMPILCARCHPSNALPGLGITTIEPLTEAIHSRHENVVDPTSGLMLGASNNRTACYRCHPGSETKCLRGAMGSATAPDATYLMQCQSCHGDMAAVGAAGRAGWLDEPACQNCHTGTATSNSGQIRYTNVFSSPGVRRTPANTTFATTPNQPATGFSLYRFSTGHGGLLCEACHGSTHAEFPTTEVNDNLQSIALQGHVGMLSDCLACHPSNPQTVMGGPHGLHPVGQAWATSHGDVAEGTGTGDCQACHGSDYRGTVLSRALGARQISTEFGSKDFWRGFQVSCYACHNGPGSESATLNRPPQVTNASASTSAATAVVIALQASDPDLNALTLRVVTQPAHGRAGINGRNATYVPDAAFAGSDSFTFAANDGFTDSNLGTVTANVSGSAQYTLSVTKNGTGGGIVASTPGSINCGATCSGTFSAGTQVSLFAQPDTNSRFDGWGGACSGTGNCTVTVGSDLAVSATFTAVPLQYTLTVGKSGNGQGTVTSAPSGIDCGANCSAAFDSGTVVTLTASPAVGSVFTGWSGACSGTGTCSVAMTQARGATASFAIPGSSLVTVTKAGTGSGTVTSSPAGIRCGSACSASFPVGTLLTLTATPAKGSNFSGWAGACAGTSTQCTFTVGGPASVQANFSARRRVTR